MILDTLLKKQNMTKYRLAVEAGIPHVTLSDICSGKTRLEKCSAETIYKIARALGVSMEILTEDGIRATEREHIYEKGLPEYLQHDLDAYKDGLKKACPIWTACGESCMAASILHRSMTAQSRRNTQSICGRNICGGNEDMNRTIDFTNCSRMPGRAYNGANGKRSQWNLRGISIC